MSKLYFKQLLAGKDFAQNKDSARAMENFIYLIGDQESHECVVVDAAWDIDGIIAEAHKDGMKIIGALVSHYHPDHVGGHIFGIDIEGIKELMIKNPCPIHAHKLEKEGIIKSTKVSSLDIVAHESHDIIKVGDIAIELLHTPGHTPGSCCFRLKNMLVSGDTLFLNGCGRVDLPGGNVKDMYDTITNRLSHLSHDTILYPGHAYGGHSDNMGNVKKYNPIWQHLDFKSFTRMMGY